MVLFFFPPFIFPFPEDGGAQMITMFNIVSQDTLPSTMNLTFSLQEERRQISDAYFSVNLGRDSLFSLMNKKINSIGIISVIIP